MRLSLPSSIVLAGVLVALGLYFGLRPPAPTGSAPTGSTTAPTQPPGNGEPPQAAEPPRPPVASDDQLRAEVVALVEAARPRWKAACWDTADPATRRPGRYVSALAFDAEGGLDVSGVGEIREKSDPVVAQCLRRQVNAFTISPPGRQVTFEIPFVMP